MVVAFNLITLLPFFLPSFRDRLTVIPTIFWEQRCDCDWCFCFFISILPSVLLEGTFRLADRPCSDQDVKILLSRVDFTSLKQKSRKIVILGLNNPFLI